MKDKKFLISIVFLSAVGYFVLFEMPEMRRKANSGNQTIGTIISTSSGLRNSTPSVKYKIKVNSRIYTGSKSVSTNLYTYLEPGEEYMVKYELDNPENSILKLEEPYLNPVVSYQITFAQPHLPEWLNPNVVEFEYHVGEKTFKRRQDFGDRDIDEYLNKKYRVYYQENNPKIAYIFLDSVVSVE